MIIPFVNWGWKKKPSADYSLRFNLSERMQEFTDASREYDARLSYFESKLDENQYKDYMDLRNCANRVVMAKDRLDFANDYTKDALK